MAENVDPHHKAFVIRIVRKYFPDAQIFAFGSRIVGSAGKYSDLDVALKQSPPVDPKKWMALQEEFGESHLPFKVDLLNYVEAAEEFQKIIDRTGTLWD